MQLTPGTKLAEYEIRASIGAGGMGEVYKARDTKLGREVAIKVLPAAFAQDAQRMARFEREARLLASLNHSNIATIHGFEKADGIRFLVMELVAGETLAEHIGRGALSMEEALGIARQIAEGLDAAHEKAVVHRDLKPANVKVTDEGDVKILDFGLAKALEDESADPADSDSPTLTRAATRAGVLLGTAAYMSPEQARGQKVDRRADIWSFGVVLFEMLTGKRLFSGDTVSDTLAAVLKTEPDWSSLPAGTPAGVRKLLRRCLERAPKERLRDIGDAGLDLKEALQEPSFEANGKATSRPVLPWVVAGLIAIVSVAVLWGLRGPSLSVPQTVMRLALPHVTPHPAATWSRALALSPEGRRLVYLGEGENGQQLYVRSLDELEARLLPGTDGAVAPVVSPDGEWVFFWMDGTVKKAALGESRPVVSVADADSWAFDWGAADMIYFASGHEIWKVAASGGEPELVATSDAPGNRYFACVEALPGDKGLIVSEMGGYGTENRTIRGWSRESGTWQTWIEDGVCARYVPTGHLIFSRGETLFAAPFNLEDLRVTGTAVPVQDGVQTVDSYEFAQFDVSQTGHLVYLTGGRDVLLASVDREGSARPLSDTPGDYFSPRVSPEGKRIALSDGTSEGADLWIFDVERGTMSRLTFDAASDHSPTWTPDGQRVTFSSDRDASRNLYWIPADGSGEAERITDGELTKGIGVWSPDGKVLLFIEFHPSEDWNIFTLAREADPSSAVQPKPFVVTRFREAYTDFSPDGRWVAFESDESGEQEIYVRPFPGPGGQRKISTNGGVEPMWNPRGGELFYLEEKKMMVVSYSAVGDLLQVEMPRLLFETEFVSRYPFASYDVFPDGEHFVMLQAPEARTEENSIFFILNWFEELKRLAPVDN